MWNIRQQCRFSQIFAAKKGSWQISYDVCTAFMQTIASFIETVRTVEQPAAHRFYSEFSTFP
jgi:hypothetical protein